MTSDTLPKFRFIHFFCTNIYVAERLKVIITGSVKSMTGGIFPSVAVRIYKTKSERC